jgi:MscS family membrane protein
VLGFLRAAQLDRYGEAGRYLQVSESRAPRLAQQLRAIMDQGFQDRLDSISTRPEGTLEDGLGPNAEWAGELRIGALRAPLLLVRVQDDLLGGIWLIAAETLAKVPTLYDQVGFPAIEDRLPSFLVNRRILSTPLWQWLAGFAALPLALGLALLLLKIPLGHSNWRTTAAAPVAVIIALLLHWAFINYLGAPLLTRYYYWRALTVAMVVIVGWLLSRLVDQGIRRALHHASSAGESAITLLALGRRIIKVFLFIAIVLVALSVMGFQTTGVLTTLGIGGIAIALAAQKTIENLIGGLTLVSDEVFRVGDLCRFGDRTGVVEDIGLRSTRIRTSERSELSIPNGALAAMNIENLSRRDRILMHQNFLLRLDTTPDQLRWVMAEVRHMLHAHPKVAADGTRMRLIGLEETGLRVEVFAYMLTTDILESIAIREDLLLRTMEIVEAGGTHLAARLEYQTPDPGLDRAKKHAAEKTVRDWRAEGALPFPDHQPEDVEHVKGTLDYPPRGSAATARRDAPDGPGVL